MQVPPTFRGFVLIAMGASKRTANATRASTITLGQMSVYFATAMPFQL
jgi:hypothetical protein